MRRIIAVIAMVLVISALSAASALACVAPPGVWAPNNDSHGQSAGNAPYRTLITCLPSNRGTNTALSPSPAIAPCID